MRRRLLFVMRHAPYGSSTAREALDALLASAVFGQDVGVLFINDGVFQLAQDQSPAALPQKNLASSLRALPLYDVERLYVHTPSLTERGLSMSDLVMDNLIELDSSAVGRLFSEQDQLLSF
ncbi:sulfurtransferase complex subunit TusC [Marinimicrobium sp. C6131]|uniref:sulfurtransferase complex subunit TusC n=1 Tax=Marinimicrobium sp. C6131 TaxID=3022676 RepID=UPI00223E480F|nr:sulfurtransferase complex subunit TusC [Marinimicrobium sp. C6131]UZJ45512.1 sulfurtransferase complex subunit TusC [Marinimicrobium sp. C6131]